MIVRFVLHSYFVYLDEIVPMDSKNSMDGNTFKSEEKWQATTRRE